MYGSSIISYYRSSTGSRLVHLQLLAITHHFLQRLVPLEIADRCLPRQLKTALCSSLLDGPLHAFFPTMHSDILQYAQVSFTISHSLYILTTVH